VVISAARRSGQSGSRVTGWTAKLEEIIDRLSSRYRSRFRWVAEFSP
jgi:hypothetical protein